RQAEIAALLGADLEVSPNRETGWDAVLQYAMPPRKASLAKIPHHGSPTAHHDQFWIDLVEDQVVAILTPWRSGRGLLPTDADLNRLRSLTNRVYLTSRPRLKRARQDHDVAKLIRDLHRERLDELTGWGQVRARRRENDDQWRVELNGDAF